MNGLEELILRDWDMLTGREHGPLAFRLILQPLVATLLGIRAGIRDARAGTGPFGWSVATEPARRRQLIQDGWKDIGRLYIAALVMDIIYQLIVFRALYPVQALVVAAVLAIPCYFFVRGLTNRIATGLGHRGKF